MRGEILPLSNGPIKSEPSHPYLVPGGLFLDDSLPCSSSFVAAVSRKSRTGPTLVVGCCKNASFGATRAMEGFRNGGFLSMSLSTKGNEEGSFREPPVKGLGNNGEIVKLEVAVLEKEEEDRKSTALNTAMHLCAGAVAAVISRTIVAPLERLKLEYIVKGEQRNLFELIQTIAASQGLKGFWKGNFGNILRTARFKAINFFSYDTYINQLMKWSGNEETTNFERFTAGPAAGITATLLCFPMDTVWSKMVVLGGEGPGGAIGTFCHMVRTDGFFSLYKGLVPTIAAMAPAGALFYGVYDILRSTYLQTPEGRKRLEHVKQEGNRLNVMEQLELGPIRTLIYGAISGVCAEATTYPIVAVRRQLQMQVQHSGLDPLTTFMKIVAQGGIPALYAGFFPSLLEVLPSAAIGYLMYELLKTALKVESR